MCSGLQEEQLVCSETPEAAARRVFNDFDKDGKNIEFCFLFNLKVIILFHKILPFIILTNAKSP